MRDYRELTRIFAIMRRLVDYFEMHFIIAIVF